MGGTGPDADLHSYGLMLYFQLQSSDRSRCCNAKKKFHCSRWRNSCSYILFCSNKFPRLFPLGWYFLSSRTNLSRRIYASKVSLKRSFIFLAIALNLPHLTYYFLSWAMPHNLALISAVVTLEKFGFGFGSIGHMLYMMQQVAPRPFK